MPVCFYFSCHQWKVLLKVNEFSKRIICHRAKEAGGGKRVITGVTAAPASLTNAAPADNGKWISAEQIHVHQGWILTIHLRRLSPCSATGYQQASAAGFCGWSLDHLLSQTEQEWVNPLLRKGTRAEYMTTHSTRKGPWEKPALPQSHWKASFCSGAGVFCLLATQSVDSLCASNISITERLLETMQNPRPNRSPPR